MSETWATVLLTLVIGVLGYIMKSNDNHARERQEKAEKALSDSIRGVKESVDKIADALGGYVRKDDCSADMGQHCKQLCRLEDSIKDNTQRLAILETSVSMYHKNKE